MPRAHVVVGAEAFTCTSARNEQEKGELLESLRKASPGSIVAQTLRLGREINDAMTELDRNQDRHFAFSAQKQTDWHCSQDQYIDILLRHTENDICQWKEMLRSVDAPLYAVNQAAIQTGWVMGYFGHLGGDGPERYLEFGLPMIDLYLEFGDNFLKAKARHTEE